MGKDYHIKLNGQLIPVTEEVYRAYQQPKWREKKRVEVRKNKEISLDAMLENGSQNQIASQQALVDEIVADKLILDELLLALAELTDDERFLIEQLFYKEKSEREFSQETGVPHPTIHSRKNSILKKLKILLNKNF